MTKFSQTMTENVLKSTMFLTNEMKIDQYIFIDVLIVHVKSEFS